jgi:hypothetical protein
MVNLLLKMDLTFLRNLLRRRDTKIIVITTVSGGVLQIICRRYIKNNPEFLEEENENLKETEPGIKNKNRNPKFRGSFPRGGAVVALPGVSIKVVATFVVKFLAENGLLAGLVTGSGVALSRIPTSAISTYLREALPQNLPELERKKLILVNGEKIYLDLCDQNIEYLFAVLKDPAMPYEEKEKLARSILTKYLNLKTVNGRVNFVLCIVFVLYIFSTQDMSSYYIILRNLIKAIKEGRVPKIVGRAIIRKLKRRGLLIDPELLEVAYS